MRAINCLGIVLSCPPTSRRSPPSSMAGNADWRFRPIGVPVASGYSGTGTPFCSAAWYAAPMAR